MFFFDCEQGYVADNGQNDVKDGSVENYDFDWEETTAQPPKPPMKPEQQEDNEQGATA